jgi:chromosome segregation ATPase
MAFENEQQGGGEVAAENPKNLESGPENLDSLKAKRAELEKRVEEIKRKKEEAIAQKMSDREALVAEDQRLAPLLEEAQGTLEYFEKQTELGVLTGEQNAKELNELGELVTSLENQRDKVEGEYAHIMSDPEVYGKIWDEAHAMDKEKMSEVEATQARAQFEADAKAKAEELKNREVVFTGHLKELGPKLEDFIEASNKSEVKVRALLNEVENILIRARHGLKRQTKIPNSIFNLGAYDDRTNWSNPNYLSDYLRSAEEVRNGLGWLDGKDKAAMDLILANKGKIEKLQTLGMQYTEEYGGENRYSDLFSEIRKEYNELRIANPNAGNDILGMLPGSYYTDPTIRLLRSIDGNMPI